MLLSPPISTVIIATLVVFILTTQELSVNKIDLQAPTLAGPTWTNLVAGSPSCTIYQQQTIHRWVVVN